MSNPKVSVVLPTLNAGEHIGEAIQSLREQTLSSFEVVIIDDGSTDNTLDIINKRGDDRFHVIEREESTGGLPGALNRGIREATSPYIARQDADDRSHPKRLAEQVMFLENTPEVALVGSSVRLIQPDGSVKDIRRVKPSPNFNDLLKNNQFIHGSVCFRKKMIKELNGYDEKFRFSEDYDLWLRIAKKYPVRNLEDVRYDLRVHDESIYSSELKRVKLYAAFARKRILNETDLSATEISENVQKIYEEFDPAERARYHSEMAQAYLRYGDHANARKHAWKSIRCVPTNLKPWAFLGLSMTPSQLVDAVIWITRRIINTRL